MNNSSASNHVTAYTVVKAIRNKLTELGLEVAARLVCRTASVNHVRRASEGGGEGGSVRRASEGGGKRSEGHVGTASAAAGVARARRRQNDSLLEAIESDGSTCQ